MDLTERRAGATRHPWEVQRVRAYSRVLSDHGALDASRVLDVGAGDGWFSDQLVADLPSDAHITCWDVNYDEHDLAPANTAVTRTRERPAAGFDLVLVLDVLEHIPHAADFVRSDLTGLAEPGTPVLVAVPAYQRLFGAHDVALGHHRRYGRSQLLSEVTPWIDVVDHGSLFTSLLLPRAVQVALERRPKPGSAPADHGIGGWSRGPTLTGVVNGALALDSWVGRRLGQIGVRLPGLSHWAFGVVR